MTTDDDGDGIVTEQRFLCPMCIEAKQTITSQFGVEKGLLQGRIRRQVAHAPKALNSSKCF